MELQAGAVGAEWPCRAPWQPHRTATREFTSGGTRQLFGCGLDRKETLSRSVRWRKGEEGQVCLMQLGWLFIRLGFSLAAGPLTAGSAGDWAPAWRKAQRPGLGSYILGGPLGTVASEQEA